MLAFDARKVRTHVARATAMRLRRGTSLAVALVGLLWPAVGAGEASAATCNFIGAQEADWHDADHWDCGVPGVIPDGDDAVVISSGPDIVRVNQNESAASVELTGGAIRLAGGVTLNVSGPLTVTSGTVNGLGTRATMNVGGGMTHASGAFNVHDDVDVVIAGASTFSGASTIGLNDIVGAGAGGDPSIRFDGALDLTASNTVVDGTGLTVGWRAFRIGATGSLARSTPGSATINVLSENAGTITVANAQTIGFSSLGWVQVSGSTIVNAGGTLNGPLTMEAGLVTGAGTVNSVQNAGGTISPATGATLTIGGMDQTAGQTTIASGEKLNINVSGADQTGGTTTVASGGELEIDPTRTWSVNGGTLTVAGTVTGRIFMNDPAGLLNGTGTITGDLTASQGTVAPGSSTGTLTVGGDYDQGPGGKLEVEVDGTTPGTQYDLLSVGGAASLDGTVAVIQGAAFDPALADTFQFLTSASRTGTFSSLAGAALPSGKNYVLNYPAAPNVGARLTVAGPPPQISVGNARIKEGDRGTKKALLRVRLSDASQQTVGVSFATVKGTAKSKSDYVRRSGLLTFQPGQVERKVAVKVIGDRRDEGAEKFFVKLTAPSGATIGDGSGTVKIRNDD